MLKIAACGIVFVLMVPQVTLADWVPVATGGGHATSVDDSSIVHRGNIASFWTRTNSATSFDGATEIRARMSINCNNGLQQTHFMAGYNEQGIRVFGGSADDTKPQRTAPGTVRAAIAEFVCQ